MALDAHGITKEQRRIVDNLERFEGLLRNAWETPWWREFVHLINEHRMARTNALLDPLTQLTQREEDRLRGEIKSLTWIIAIDLHGKQLHERNEGGA